MKILKIPKINKFIKFQISILLTKQYLNKKIKKPPFPIKNYQLRYGALINAKDHNGDTGLIRAAWKNKFEMAKLLIELGADPKIRSNAKQTALDWAKKGKNAELIKYLESVTKE